MKRIAYIVLLATVLLASCAKVNYELTHPHPPVFFDEHSMRLEMLQNELDMLLLQNEINTLHDSENEKMQKLQEEIEILQTRNKLLQKYIAEGNDTEQIPASTSKWFYIFVGVISLPMLTIIVWILYRVKQVMKKRQAT